MQKFECKKQNPRISTNRHSNPIFLVHIHAKSDVFRKFGPFWKQIWPILAANLAILLYSWSLWIIDVWTYYMNLSYMWTIEATTEVKKTPERESDPPPITLSLSSVFFTSVVPSMFHIYDRFIEYVHISKIQRDQEYHVLCWKTRRVWAFFALKKLPLFIQNLYICDIVS